jgi:hypothetical protein
MKKTITFTKGEIEALLNVLGNTSEDDGSLKSVFIGDLRRINKYIIAENKLRSAINWNLKMGWTNNTLKNEDGAY